MRISPVLIGVFVLLMIALATSSYAPVSYVKPEPVTPQNIKEPVISQDVEIPQEFSFDVSEDVSAEPIEPEPLQGDDDLIYGGAGYQFEPSGHFFTFNTTSGTFSDKGQPVFNEEIVWSLTKGLDGKVYGGTAYNAHFFIYDPDTGNYTDKGSLTSNDILSSLVTAPNGKIYGSAFRGSVPFFFEYDPTTDVITDKSHLFPDGISIRDLVYRPDDKIYMTTLANFTTPNYSEVHIFSYDLSSEVVEDSGSVLQPDPTLPYYFTPMNMVLNQDCKLYSGVMNSNFYFVQNETYLIVYDPVTKTSEIEVLKDVFGIWGMTAGTDYKVYLGQMYWRREQWDPHLYSYDPLTKSFNDEGSVAAPSQHYITSLMTYKDGKIYGGISNVYGNDSEFFIYDPNTGIFTNKGSPLPGLGKNMVLDLAPETPIECNITAENDTTPPIAPVFQRAVLTGPNYEDVEMSWYASPDEGLPGGTVKYIVGRFRGNFPPAVGVVAAEIVANGSSIYTFTDMGRGDGDSYNYFYSISAVDDANNSASSWYAGKFVNSLTAGEKFISIPLEQWNTSVEEVLKTLSFDKVRYYDASDLSDHWKTYMTFKPYKGDLRNIDHKMGFWVNVLYDDNFTVAGLVPEYTEIPLYKGWNMVGYPSLIDRTVFEALAGVPWLKVEAYDDVAPYYLKELLSFDIMSAGNGYWIEVSNDTIWNVTNDANITGKRPDLYIVSMNVFEEPVMNASIANVTISNKGTAIAEPPIYVDVNMHEISGSYDYDCGWIVQNNITVGQLSIAGCGQILASSNYTITVRVDLPNIIEELDETNNEMSIEYEKV